MDKLPKGKPDSHAHTPKSKLLDDARDHRAGFKLMVADEHIYEDQGETLWPMYAKTMTDYVFDFGEYFHEAFDIPNRIKEKRERTGKKILMVDVAGAASGRLLGADKTISIIPKHWDSVTPDESQTIVEGDVLSRQGIHALTNAIKETGLSPSYIFFRPGAAFARAEFNQYEQGRMYTMFITLYELLDEGGEMYIDLRFLQLAPQLKDALKNADIPFEVKRHEKLRYDHGLFRIRKPATPTQLK